MLHLSHALHFPRPIPFPRPAPFPYSYTFPPFIHSSHFKLLPEISRLLFETVTKQLQGITLFIIRAVLARDNVVHAQFKCTINGPYC